MDSNENGKQLVAYYVREKSNSQIDINDLQESLATQLRYSFVYPVQSFF
ncbi:hypothetical protein [Bacillus atrophaeus]